MDVLTDVLKDFTFILNTISTNLSPMAVGLVTILSIIEISLISFEIGEADILKTLVKKGFKICFYYWVIIQYQFIINNIIDGFSLIGETSLNVINNEILTNPSKIIDIGADYAIYLFSLVKYNPSTWGYLIIGSIILFSFTFIAMFTFVLWIEIALMTGIAIVFIPFGILKKTTFITEKVFSMILGLGIKLLMTIVILSISMKFINELPTEPKDMGEILQVQAIVLTLAYLTARIPQMANSLINGSPSLGGNDLVALVAGATTSAIAGAKNVQNGGNQIGQSIGATISGFKGKDYEGGSKLSYNTGKLVRKGANKLSHGKFGNSSNNGTGNPRDSKKI